MGYILRSWKSIYDLLESTYAFFTVIGAAPFSRARRYDGKNVYFKDKCDFLRSGAVTVFAMTGYTMLFFYSPYVIQTSFIDNLCYKTVFFFVVCAGITVRILAAIRTNMFLTALKLIEDMDSHMRNRGISVNCKKAEYAFFLYCLIPLGCVLVLMCYYYSDTTSPEDNIYEIVHMMFSFAISYLTIGSYLLYLAVIAITFTDRIQHLSDYLAVTVFAMTGYTMLFFYSPYVIQTSFIDNLCYKTVFFFVVCAGITVRILAAIRTNMFLTALKLIEDMDSHMRNRGISVNCKKAEYAFFLYCLIPLGCVLVLMCYYYSDTTSPEDNIYEIVHMMFSFAISYLTIGSQLLYLAVVAITLTDRMQHLSDYLDELKTLKNTKIIEQEVVVVSQLHLKICQSWTFTLKSYGLSMVCIMIMVYAYSIVAISVVMGFLVPKLSKISFLPALVLLGAMPHIVMIYQKLQDSAEEFKSHVVDLCLERNAEKNVNLVCRTLLLQIAHVNIDLLIFGIMRLDPQSYLEGLKSMSTLIMFLVQIRDS